MSNNQESRAQAYCDVLFAHIDRLKDPCEDVDPLERIVGDLTQAFDRVAASDSDMNRLRTYYRYHGLEPWPAAGTALWVDDPLYEGALALEGRVQVTFEGNDYRVYCVLEIQRDTGFEYIVSKVLELRPAPGAPTYLEAGMRNPRFAQEFGQAA